MENQTASEIINDYGYENWTSLNQEQEYAISKEKVAKSAAAIKEKKKEKLIRDLQALAKLQDKRNLPMKPPARSGFNE